MTLWRLGVVAASKSAAGETFGYSGGGRTGPGADIASVQKMSFTTETFTALTSFPANFRRSKAVASPTTAYFALNTTDLRKINMTTDAQTALPGAYPGPSSNAGGDQAVGSSTTVAYFAGGYQPGPGPWGPDGGPGVNLITKFTFSSETGSRIPQTLGANLRGKTGTSSPTHSYAFGGFAGPNSTSSTVEKIAFSNDAVSVIPAGMSVGRNSAYSFSSPTHAYVGGGGGGVDDGVPQPSINKFSFADDSRSTLPITYFRANAGAYNSSTNAYVLGGTDGPGATTNTVQKFVTATDTTSAAPTNLPTGVFWILGTARPI